MMMKYLKWGTLLISLIFMFGFIIHPKNNENSLYDKGYNAYQNKNYVDGLKYLYAYKIVNERELASNHVDFFAKLNNAISDCEFHLRQKLVIIRERENSGTSYFNGNGYEVPKYLKEFIKNQNTDSPVIIFGGNGYELPENYKSYLKDSKLPEFDKVQFVKIKNNNLIIDKKSLNKYLKNNMNNEIQLENINKVIQFQLYYQQMQLKN